MSEKLFMEIALEYVGRREVSGTLLADKESVQGMLGEVGLQIQIGRLLTMNAAWHRSGGRTADCPTDAALSPRYGVICRSRMARARTRAWSGLSRRSRAIIGKEPQLPAPPFRIFAASTSTVTARGCCE
jgi:alkylation response protein AidB-like acyl-CoA dehydrogenase